AGITKRGMRPSGSGGAPARGYHPRGRRLVAAGALQDVAQPAEDRIVRTVDRDRQTPPRPLVGAGGEFLDEMSGEGAARHLAAVGVGRKLNRELASDRIDGGARD